MWSAYIMLVEYELRVRVDCTTHAFRSGCKWMQQGRPVEQLVRVQVVQILSALTMLRYTLWLFVVCCGGWRWMSTKSRI